MPIYIYIQCNTFVYTKYFLQINKTAPLSDKHLYDIANEISPNYLFNLGLNLGLSRVEIEQIIADNETSVLRISNVLWQWRDKRLCDNQPIDVMSELGEVFEKLCLPNAIRELTSVA